MPSLLTGMASWQTSWSLPYCCALVRHSVTRLPCVVLQVNNYTQDITAEPNPLQCTTSTPMSADIKRQQSFAFYGPTLQESASR